MKVETVSRDLGCSIDEAQEAIDNNQVAFDIKTNRYYLKSSKSSEEYNEAETELYQDYIESKEHVRHYIDAIIINHQGFNEDMNVLEVVCHSLIRRIERIREYEKTH